MTVPRHASRLRGGDANKNRGVLDIHGPTYPLPLAPIATLGRMQSIWWISLLPKGRRAGETGRVQFQMCLKCRQFLQQLFQMRQLPLVSDCTGSNSRSYRTEVDSERPHRA